MRLFDYVNAKIWLLCFLGIQNPLQAQITPDNNLPDNSQVTTDANIFKIDGGTTAGNNLFHSFLDFSIPTNHQAFFNNSLAIKNIISRITGNNISQIDGLIRANGNANLFLINPNGFLFGPNASLNIGGSFIASTANSIHFADGSEFSAKNPQNTPLLTVSVPIGLQYGHNSGEIRVLGTGNDLSIGDSIFDILQRNPQPKGLKVNPSNTLALIGGDVMLEGSTLTAEEGHIEIGSVESGLVSLNLTSSDLIFGYDKITNFKNIQLSKAALVDVSGVGSGSIQMQGAQITLTDGSVLLSQNLGSQAGGNININASDSLKLTGTSFDKRIRSQINTQTLGIGNGSTIFINAPKLIIEDGARVDTVTLSSANAGSIFVTSKQVHLSGIAPAFAGFMFPFYTSQINTRTQGLGRAGDVNISSDRLMLHDGANIVSAANLGTGKGGDVNLHISDLIELIGVEPNSLFSSAIGTTSVIGGDAGNLTINTAKLVLRDGGRVDASTFAFGKAGNIIINASEFVEVSGIVPNSINPTLIIASANKLDPLLRQNNSLLPEIPIGDSGNLTINTPRLSIAEGAQVTVRNDGTGRAGNLMINAGSIFLNDQGGITASTQSGEGGNITLNVQDILELRNNSSISATAGGSGNGGNIDINSEFLIAFPDENSDISANAFAGSGGQVAIAVDSIFGIEFENTVTNFSDITASSEFGISGEVRINTPDVDPSYGLIKLPETLVDPNALIAQNPCQKSAQSKFIVTGRGGLPPSINEDLSSEAIEVGLVESASTVGNQRQIEQASAKIPDYDNPIIFAQGWILNDKGQVVLTAYNPTVTNPQRLVSNSNVCGK